MFHNQFERMNIKECIRYHLICELWIYTLLSIKIHFLLSSNLKVFIIWYKSLQELLALVKKLT
jgi:hypothetical protein